MPETFDETDPEIEIVEDPVFAIPVPVSRLLSILNLPTDMTENTLWAEHEPLVLEVIRGYTGDEPYLLASTEEVVEDTPLVVAFRFAYCFLMLHSTAEFLNLKTLGEGIVKSIGLDQSATELLSGHEIEAWKAKLELRALTQLRAHLNKSGQERLLELKPRLPKVLRAGVI